MKKKKEVKYLNKLFKKMRQQFKRFVHKQTPEALHGFRVQVKKVTSFLTLLEASNKNNMLVKTFKPVKKIFKASGIIRDAQVYQKQAKENHIDTSQFYKEQDDVRQQETNKLLKRQRRHLRQMKKVKLKLEDRLHAISENEIQQFFSVQFSETEKLLQSHDFSEQLHNGRKMLKHLLYNQPIMPQAVATRMQIKFDSIDAMQQVIGDWHDNKLAMDLLSNKLPPKKLESLKQKQELLKKKITLKSRGFSETIKFSPQSLPPEEGVSNTENRLLQTLPQKTFAVNGTT